MGAGVGALTKSSMMLCSSPGQRPDCGLHGIVSTSDAQVKNVMIDPSMREVANMIRCTRKHAKKYEIHVHVALYFMISLDFYGI